MFNSILKQDTAARTTNDPFQHKEKKVKRRPVFDSSVLSEEEGEILVGEDRDSAMFDSSLVDGYDGDPYYESYTSVPATPPNHGSSPSSAYTSPRPSVSPSSSCLSSLDHTLASFNYLPSSIPQHERAPSSWSPTSTSPLDFSMTPEQDPFGLSSLVGFGRVEEDHVAGGFEQDQHLNWLADLLAADRLPRDEIKQAREEANRRMDQDVQGSRPMRPPQHSPLPTTISTAPAISPPLLTSEHTNPYYELACYRLQTKPPSSTASVEVIPGFTNHPIALALTSCPPLHEEGEDFATALARLRRKQGNMKFGFPRIRWLDEGVWGDKE